MVLVVTTLSFILISAQVQTVHIIVQFLIKDYTVQTVHKKLVFSTDSWLTNETDAFINEARLKPVNRLAKMEFFILWTTLVTRISVISCLQLL